ncbi:hypothetical protein AB0J80_28595 [Actinoplanes sp. NPDC049548]|uniref:hypothetical protein n=1 Tax=Actinoplanes sp. NPDC049548 TaxID=3155152 RepID=UPI003435AD1D
MPNDQPAQQYSYGTNTDWSSYSESPGLSRRSSVYAPRSGGQPFGSSSGHTSAPRTYGSLGEAFSAPYPRPPKDRTFDGMMETYGQLRESKQRHSALVAEAAAKTKIPMNREATEKYAAAHAHRVRDSRAAAAARIETTRGRGVANPYRADPTKLGPDVIPPWVRAQGKAKGPGLK